MLFSLIFKLKIKLVINILWQILRYSIFVWLKLSPGLHLWSIKQSQWCVTEGAWSLASKHFLFPFFMSPKHPIKGLHPSWCKVGKKIDAAIFSFCLLQSVIEMENQMNGKQIIVLSIFPACPTRVSAEWSWVGDMTRTKCEIEQLGGNKSALTTKSDQHVAAAGSSPFTPRLKAVHTKWGIFISLLLHLILLSNIFLSPDGKSRSRLLLLLSLLVCDIETIIEGILQLWASGPR